MAAKEGRSRSAHRRGGARGIVTRKLPAALVLLALTGPAAAAPSGPGPDSRETYILRYLVFQHQDYWDDDLRTSGPPAPDWQAASEDLPGPAAWKSPFKSLWERLAQSSRYRPLLHGTAAPRALPPDRARLIDLRETWPASIRFPFAALDRTGARPLRVILGGGWAPPDPREDWDADRLRGTLRFHKGRYAHLDVNLVFTEHRRWMPWGLDVRHYMLKQSRRMLPGRYYYFDHPRFGVVARIDRVE